MKNILLLAIIFWNCTAKAQQWQWAKNITSPTDYDGRSVLAAGNDGDFYMGTNSDFSSCIIKFNSLGNELWRRTFSGEIIISGIASKFGNLYVSGNFKNSVTVYSTTLVSAGMTDIFLMRLTSDGNFVWVQTMGGTENDTGNGLTTDKMGNVYLTGDYSDTVTFGTQNLTCACGSNMYIAKFDSLGSILLLKTGACMWGPGSFSRGQKITVDENANIFVFGNYSYFYLDTFAVSGGGGPYGAWFITKLDSLGNVSWVEPIGGYAILDLFQIAGDADENVLITGYDYWTSGGSTVTIKYDSDNGQILWAKGSSGSCWGAQGVSEGIATEGNSSYIIGRVSLCAPGRHKLLLIKYDSLGVELVHDTIEANTLNLNFDIVKDSNGDFIICGLMQTGSLTFGTDVLNVSSGIGLFIAKFKGSNSTASVPNINLRERVIVYPNPSTGIFTVNTQNSMKICLYDVLGNCLWTKEFGNNENVKIDLSTRSKGIYFVEMLSDGERTVKKIVLN